MPGLGPPLDRVLEKGGLPLDKAVSAAYLLTGLVVDRLSPTRACATPSTRPAITCLRQAEATEREPPPSCSRQAEATEGKYVPSCAHKRRPSTPLADTYGPKSEFRYSIATERESSTFDRRCVRNSTYISSQKTEHSCRSSHDPPSSCTMLKKVSCTFST